MYIYMYIGINKQCRIHVQYMYIGVYKQRRIYVYMYIRVNKPFWIHVYMDIGVNKQCWIHVQYMYIVHKQAVQDTCTIYVHMSKQAAQNT